MAKIARTYHVAIQDLAELNNVQNKDDIAPGQKLNIPGTRDTNRTIAKRRRSRTIKTFHGKFAWPINGPLHSYYGIRHGRRHDGIDIGAKRGAPIYAAAAGEVAFSGRLSGYGKLVIVRHPDRYYTAYAHNATNLVKQGDRVRKGERIAKVGTTGRSTGPHLHFEVRRGREARNPLFFLQPRNKTEQQIAKGGSAQGKVAASQGRFRGSRKKVAAGGGQGRWKKYRRAKNGPTQIHKAFRRK